MAKRFKMGDSVRVVQVDDEDVAAGVNVGDVATVEIEDDIMLVTFPCGMQRFMLPRQMEIA